MYIINIIHNTNLIYVDSEICSTENICLYIYIYIHIYKISTNCGSQERQLCIMYHSDHLMQTSLPRKVTKITYPMFL